DSWDDSVKTLVNYPEVVKQMSGDLDWTSDLGEAVVADQGAVLDAVQAFRRKAQAAGNLKSDGKQVVEVEKEIIKIVPADPQVIYVPQYNPSSVVVYSAAPVYGYYPAPYPSYYYPYAPGAALATGLIWGAAIGAAWSGGRWGASYSGGGNTINIDNSVNRSGGARASQQPSGQWKSNKQAGQVSGSTGRTQGSSRVGDGSRGDGSRGDGSRGGGDRGGGDRGGGDRGGGARASQQPSGGFGGGDRGGGGAFGGANSSGRDA